MMKFRYNVIAVIVACVMPLGVAQATPSSNVAWTVETHSLVKRGDASVGAEIETVETEDVNACTDCHGPRGAEPDRDKHPTLAGQVAAYTFKQLRDYKDGKRQNRRMQEAVERLSDEQLANHVAAMEMDGGVERPVGWGFGLDGIDPNAEVRFPEYENARNRLLQIGALLKGIDADEIRRGGGGADISPLTRCIRCNGTLSVVEKQSVYHRLEPKTQRYYEEFRICDNCRQVYWKGSHFRKMNRLIEEFRQALTQHQT